jgi:serine/threonine-protein kinase
MSAPDDEDLGSAPTSSPDPEPEVRPSAGFRAVGVGTRLGRYELVEELGEGGMATVYRARDHELRRDVAIKVLFPHLAKRAEIVRRFDREARAAAKLEHPNILRVYDVGGGEPGPGNDPPYIVMELIRGTSLKEIVEQRGPLLAELAACAGALLADALAVAHAAGVIHRDVKPANVMVAPGGRLLLADFGVARVEDDDSLVTRTGALLGTPAFMSPEQATGTEVDARSDVYSLGASLYQLATGHLPHTGSAPRVVAAIASGELIAPVRRRPAVGSDLSRQIERMMATDPARRPADAAAAAAELRRFVSDAGLGDPADELAAYFADPDAYTAAKTPVVVQLLATRARAARAEGKLPRAMALVDRASALAPGDPAIATLVEDLAQRRGSGWLIAAGVGTLAVAAAAGVVVWRGMGATAGADAAPPDAAIDAAPIADATAVVPAIDAAAIPDARTGEPRKVDGRVRITDAAVAIAPVAAGDAAVAIRRDPPDAAPARPGTIAMVMDSWCELTIDGAPRGKADGTGKRFTVDPGTHEVACTKLGKTFRERVTVAAGATVTVKGALLGTVRVTIGTASTVVIGGTTFQKGDSLEVVPGRLRVVVGGTAVFVNVPNVDACRLEDTGDRASPLDCFR